MNKSSSLLLHLHLHLLHLLIMNKSSNLLKKKKTINQNFQFLEKIQDFQIFQTKKKLSIKIFNSLKKCKISKFEKRKNSLIKIFNSFKKFKFSKFKKKKKSSLNSSSGTESYDPLPHSPVMQHQVNCPPSAFFKAWSMS